MTKRHRLAALLAQQDLLVGELLSLDEGQGHVVQDDWMLGEHAGKGLRVELENLGRHHRHDARCARLAGQQRHLADRVARPQPGDQFALAILLEPDLDQPVDHEVETVAAVSLPADILLGVESTARHPGKDLAGRLRLQSREQMQGWQSGAHVVSQRSRVAGSAMWTGSMRWPARDRKPRGRYYLPRNVWRAHLRARSGRRDARRSSPG